MLYTSLMHLRRDLSSLVLLLAFVFFLYRGPIRGMATTGFNDFAGSYTIAHVWLKGADCYSARNQVEQWVNDGRPAYQFVLKAGRSSSPGGSGSGLPACIPFIAPFTLLSSGVADRMWIWLTAAAVAVMLLALFRDKSIYFLALALSLTTLHTGIKGGNASALVVACLGFSYLWRFERPILSGILLGVAGCFKPHLAGAGLLFFMLERAWMPVVASVLTGFAATTLFALRYTFNPVGISWLPALISRTGAIGYAGGPDDFSLANPARYELVNLQVVLGSVLSNRTTVNAIAIGVVIVLVALWAWWMYRREVSHLVGFAAINVILLLPSYHRINDAGVVVFAIAAAATLERHSRLIALAFIPFIAPIPAALINFGQTGRIPAWLFQNKLFIVIVLCHEVWILFGVALFFLAMMSRAPARKAVEPIVPAQPFDRKASPASRAAV